MAVRSCGGIAMSDHLLIIGFGYSAAALVEQLQGAMAITATLRRREAFARAEASGVRPILFDGVVASPDVRDSLARTTHLLISAPPGSDGDPLLRLHAGDFADAPRLAWIGYLSTIGVYGDHQGGMVDERTPPAPLNARSRLRLAAENAWLDVAASKDIALHIFRLGGIYGPGRNTLVALAEGSQKRVIKPGQVFNRIHVEDVAGLVAAGMARPPAGTVFNGVDEEPSAPQEVVLHAASLMGITPPPEVPLEQAGLSPMGLSFYGENKRVSSRWTREVLGYELRYPTYREGLAALASARDWERSAPPDA